MSLLDSLTGMDWSCLVLALLLSLGPGYALLSLHPDHRDLESIEVWALSVGLGVGFWPVLLAWLHGLDIILTPVSVFVITGLGWAVGLVRRRPWSMPRRGISRTRVIHIALFSILGATAVTGMYALRDIVVGPGSDSYHHSLIAHMIAEHGALPNSYEPFAPLTTFSYHFGFHGMVAVLSWLSGIETVTLVPLLGQLLNAAAALSVAFFTLVVTGNRFSATVAAAFSGLVAVFPAFFINWGRFTQLAGLVVLPIFMGLVWRWLQTGHRWSAVPLIGVLAAGTALVHYRVTLMAAVAVVVFLGGHALAHWTGWETWKEIILRLIVVALVAGVLVAPWVWHVLDTIYRDYANDVSTPERAYFRLKRLGDDVLTYPTNRAFIGLSLIAVFLGWWRQEHAVMTLSAWTVALLLLSAPRFGGIFMDTVSVVVSLYFPAAVIIGWLARFSLDWLAPRWQPLQWMGGLALLGLILQGVFAIGSIVEPGAVYVREDDVPAMAWIRENTTTSAYFMVNTFSWDFAPDYVIGSDAGYWLPLLTGRRTVTLPMTYPLERSSTPDLAQNLAALHQLGGDLASPEAVALLRREGITHVYVGHRGGPIAAEDLLASPTFDLRYRHGKAYVFRVN